MASIKKRHILKDMIYTYLIQELKDMEYYLTEPTIVGIKTYTNALPLFSQLETKLLYALEVCEIIEE